MSERRAWAHEAIRRIEADYQRSSDTHLIPLQLPGFPGIDLYLKDKSALACAQTLRDAQQARTIITLLCDDGERYPHDLSKKLKVRLNLKVKLKAPRCMARLQPAP